MEELVSAFEALRGSQNGKNAARQFPPDEQVALLRYYVEKAEGIKRRCSALTEADTTIVKSMCAIYTVITGLRPRCTNCSFPQTLAQIKGYLARL
jgi:hypothetical protein